MKTKWERIVELIESGMTHRQTQRKITEEYGSCSKATVMRWNRKTNKYWTKWVHNCPVTRDSEVVHRVAASGINPDDIHSMWIKVPASEWAPWYSAYIKMPDWSQIDYIEKIREVVNSASLSSIYTTPVTVNDKALFVVLSDMHVWLDGKWQYNYKYWPSELERNISVVLSDIAEQASIHWSFDRIVLLDLWDWLDWWNWQTTRWWHSLQQNLDNAGQFKVYVDIKMKMINTIIQNGWCSQLVIRNVTNDNHCFDDQTEILTNNWWKTIDTYSENDLVSSMWSNGELKFSVPVKKHIIDYKWQMHHYKSAIHDVAVTPNHRLLCKKNWEDRWYHLSEDIFSKKITPQFKVALNNINDEADVSDDILRLMWRILTDWTIRYYEWITKSFVIYQSKQQNIDRIVWILSRLGIDYLLSEKKSEEKIVIKWKEVKTKNKIYSISINRDNCDHEILYFLQDQLTSKTSTPPIVNSLSKRQSDILINEIFMGDGNIRETINEWVMTHRSGTLYWTYDFLSRVQLMIASNWHRANLKKDNRWDRRLLVVFNRETSSISLSRESIDYDWRIWCFSTEYWNLVTRRNWFISIQWNCWSFGLIANMAVEQICTALYPDRINIGNYTQFMQHFNYWVNTFILTHGKDEKHQKYWLPLMLNPKAESFINNYINVHWIQDKTVHVLKWDLHQLAYGHSKTFSYHNFWSFAAPSWWVQANFWDSYSSYSLLVVDKNKKWVNRYDRFVEYEKELITEDNI